MSRLPSDIVNEILEYDGSIKYRKGIYADQIPKNDVRYKILKEIQPFTESIYFPKVRLELKTYNDPSGVHYILLKWKTPLETPYMEYIIQFFYNTNETTIFTDIGT